jgi:hypothetical protein
LTTPAHSRGWTGNGSVAFIAVGDFRRPQTPALGLALAQTRAKGQALWTPFPLRWPSRSAPPFQGWKGKQLHAYTSFLYIRAMRSQAKAVSDALFEIAEGQQGYFTAKQAADAGYQFGSQAHHVKSGNWVRVERGIYRLARFPQSVEEQLVIYTLWSRNRAGDPQGVYSHQTALSIQELSDVNPAKLHMTVPAAFRRRAKAPKVLVLHRASLDAKDVEQRQGFAVTRPLRAIADVAGAESVSRDIVEQALTEGRQRGLITVRELSELNRPGQFPKWFDELLAESKR